MVRLTHERILLIGDHERELQTALGAALPSAAVTTAASVFDGLAELHAGVYTSVVVGIEPIGRRPEAACRALREAAGDSRIILVASPTNEPVTKRLIDNGCDDYVITPVQAADLRAALSLDRTRFERPADGRLDAERRDGRAAPDGIAPSLASPPAVDDPLHSFLTMPLADILLDALLQQPQQAVRGALAAIAERLGPELRLTLLAEGTALPPLTPGRQPVSQPVQRDQTTVGTLLLDMPASCDEAVARQGLAQVAALLGKADAVDDRQGRLQKLAITDDLTGVYNARYFKHFLQRILEKARVKRFPVTLLLFDLDNFKRYNDLFGHGVGDEILRQTAALMKKCSRDHDLVARISGDEFAVVFWEKEGPRLPREAVAPAPTRMPQTPLVIADRFRKLLHGKGLEELSALGPGGKGVLTISGGMAVYPYDARNAEELIEAADKALMFGAKKSGKNAIYLVGPDDEPATRELP